MEGCHYPRHNHRYKKVLLYPFKKDIDQTKYNRNCKKPQTVFPSYFFEQKYAHKKKYSKNTILIID